MKRWRLVLLGMMMIFVVPVWVAGTESQPERGDWAAPQEQKTAPLIWTGKSGGFEIRWTTADIQARPLKESGRLAFSASQLARRGFQRFISPPHLDGSEKHITYEREFTLLSVVGSIISLRDELYYEITPSAHPGGEIRFTALDLAKPGEVPDPLATEEGFRQKKLGKVAMLTDYFPEKEVLKALLENAMLKEILGGESPQSLANLLQFLQDRPIEINEVPCLIPDDFLTRFAFHQLQGDRVVVSLGLPSMGGAFRSFHAELDLRLPIPPAIKNSLTLAVSGKEGFLMADRKRIAGGEYNHCIIQFTKGKKPPDW